MSGPVVIAHRGASGYLPEHTLPAKALAYAMGADFLEQDVVATRDDELIVLHDLHIDRVSNVADVYLWRRANASVQRVSVSSAGVQADATSENARLSGDGQHPACAGRTVNNGAGRCAPPPSGTPPASSRSATIWLCVVARGCTMGA